MTELARIDSQAIAGVVAPEQHEAMIREVWATVAAYPAVATIARKLILSIALAPLGWLALLPFWAMRLLGFLPGLSFLTTKFTVTNRRLMIRKGVKAKPVAEIPLDQVKDVRIVTDANTEYYLSANLEVLRLDGSVAMTMTGVPEPESFRHTILQSVKAWGPLLTPRKSA